MTLLRTEESLAGEGVVVESLPYDLYRVELENGHRIVAHVSGKVRMDFTRIVPGDRVQIELGPYDLTRGRITLSLKPEIA